MLNLNPNLNTVNVNGLNVQLKTEVTRVHRKAWPNYMLSTRNAVQIFLFDRDHK